MSSSFASSDRYGGKFANLPKPRDSRNLKRAVAGVLGVLIGGVFLWLALRHIDPRELKAALHEMDVNWLITAVAIYLLSIGVRCLRWGVLLRATDNVKWRHAAEALVTGFAANYVLPGRIGELFRADYARRVFNMSRFTSLGTIVVERVCDGIILVWALWISFAWLLFTRFALAETSWILTVAAAASLAFGVALALILLTRRIDLRRFDVPDGIAARWDRLVDGVSSVARGNKTAVVLFSIGVWTLEVLALNSLVHSFGISLSLPETLMVLGLASLSTLVPTAPGYVGTYQLVFGHVFQTLGYPQTIGVMAATAVQIFCFGSVTILGGFVLLSRSGLSIWRAHKWVHQKDRDSCATP
jgi:glycosyltransferase 2 family protein